MFEPTFDFDNDYGITVPSLKECIAETEVYCGRFTGVVFPGAAGSLCYDSGVGPVHLVRDKLTDRLLLLLLPEDALLTDPTARNQLAACVALAKALTHPHITRIHDLHQFDLRLAISMQPVWGRTLKEWQLLRAPHATPTTTFFGVADIAPWIAQLCGAVAYWHAETGQPSGLIRPTSLMLERFLHRADGFVGERLLLPALNIFEPNTKNLPTAQQAGAAARLLMYHSPQLIKGALPTFADDVYSIGATIYELLTGRPPFYQGDARSIQHQSANLLPPPMASRRQEFGASTASPIPENWETAIAQCLEKDPERRPKTALELAHSLALEAAPMRGFSAVNAQPA